MVRQIAVQPASQTSEVSTITTRNDDDYDDDDVACKRIIICSARAYVHFYNVRNHALSTLMLVCGGGCGGDADYDIVRSAAAILKVLSV